MDTTAFDESVAHTLDEQAAAMAGQNDAQSDVWLVLEGDFGGQVYLTIPWKCLGPNARVGQLLREMDVLAWKTNAFDGASAKLQCARSFEDIARVAAETGTTLEELAAAHGYASWDAFVAENRLFVSGGMGGGWLVDNGLWLHEEFLGIDRVPESLQPLLDDLRGATAEQVRAMDWTARAVELLDLLAA